MIAIVLSVVFGLAVVALLRPNLVCLRRVVIVLLVFCGSVLVLMRPNVRTVVALAQQKGPVSEDFIAGALAFQHAMSLPAWMTLLVILLLGLVALRKK